MHIRITYKLISDQDQNFVLHIHRNLDLAALFYNNM